jgi:hypothetical protein
MVAVSKQGDYPMIRLSAIILMLLGATGSALADDDTPAAPTTAQQNEIASCKDALAQITPILKATEAYAQSVAASGPGSDTTVPSVLTGARRAALANAYKSFNAIRPDLEQLQGNLAVLVEVTTACANGQLDP